MKVGIQIKGIDDLTAKLRTMGDEVQEAAREATDAAALMAQGEIRRRLKKKGTGHIYTHHMFTGPGGKVMRGRERNKPHQASAPGSHPVTDTGMLTNSVAIASDLAVMRQGVYVVSVQSHLQYAFWLEFGTRKMAARPMWRPVAKWIAPKYRGMLEQIIKGAVQ